MIKLTDKDKTLTIPSGLGNFGQGSGSGGGITPEEAAEIASAVTAEALDEYDTELQVDLEEIREAVSANTGTLLDLSQIAVMTVADRVALFDEIYDKAASGEKVYIKGLVQEETIRTAILPLVSYRPETNPILHQGGYLYFAAKGDTDNIYFHVALSSEGAIDPTSSTLIKRNIYTLPTASSEVKGGVKVGSGLLMTQDTLSVDTTGLVTDGDLAPFIVQLSGNTQDIGVLSGAVETLSTSLSAYTTNDTFNAGISGLTEQISGLSATTEVIEENLETVSGKAGEVYDAIFYEEEGETYSQIDDLWDAVDEKQDVLEAGSGISIDNNTVSVNIGPGLTLDNKGYNQVMVKLGEGLHFTSGDTIGVKIGDGLGFSGDTLVVSGGTGGGKTPIVLEEHYGDPTWTAIYSAVAQSAVTMGVEEFAKNYDIYIKKLDDQENPYALYQAVGYAMQEGSDWDEDLQEDVQTTWLTFYTFENGGYTYWLLSTGSRGLGAITGFYPDSVAHPKSAWINIDTSGNVIDYNIEKVDEGLAQYNDNGTDYAFSMYLVCTPGDAERYRGNLQNFYKSYSGVSGDYFFRFVIDIEGTEYEAEYYWDQANQQIVKIVFQPYKTYLQSILNS